MRLGISRMPRWPPPYTGISTTRRLRRPLQLDDCKRAIKDGTKTIALNELEDAIRRLKLLAKHLDA